MKSTTEKSHDKTLKAPNRGVRATELFKIVVVGASEGGPEAISELLSALPPAPGMAFIYAQHHVRGTTGKLKERLSRNTTMDVRELVELHKIGPNQVYITAIDHGNDISIDGNTTDHKKNGEFQSIDSLFSLAAKTFGNRVIGIILDGTLDDGVIGCQDIKTVGGLIFSQNDSAKFPHLPHLAVSKGVVDHVLNAKDIASQLVRLNNLHTTKPNKKGQGPDNGLEHQQESGTKVTTNSVNILNEELKNSEARYRDLLFGLPVAVYTCNVDGYIELYNEAAAKLWGTRPVIGKDLWCGSWKIFRQNGTPLPFEECPMALALKQQKPVSFEILIERPDGTRRNILPNPQPTFDTYGNLTGAINTLIDITPQVEAHNKIQESETQFSTLANNIQNLAWMANADGWVFWYNQRWYEYTGTTKEEMEGWGWRAVHDPQYLPLVVKQWRNAIESKKPFEMTFPVKGADGKFRSFISRAFPLFDADGNISRWVGTHTDIHDHLEHSDFLEANLKEVYQEMQAILHFAPDAVITIDEKGTIISWNPEAESIFGWKKEETLGRSLTETIIPERFAQMHTRGMELFLKTGEGPAMNKALEMFAVKKDGVEIPVELKISGTKINDRHIFIGFLRDISVRKQAQETIINKTSQLIEAQQLALIGSWEWDVKSDKITWSDELFRIFGLEPQDSIPSYENYLNYIHKDDRDNLNATIQQAFNDHQSYKFIHRITCPDGTIKYIKARGQVFTNEQNETIRLAGTAQDITDWQKRESELKASEERFFKIFDSNPVPMSLSEIKTNKIRYVNSLFCSLFGYTREEIIGKTSEELQLIEPREYDRVISYIFEHLQESRTLEEVQNLSIDETEQLLLNLKQTDAMKDFEVQYTSKSGETFPAIVSYEIIRLHSERFMITSYQDISERKRAEKLLKTQNEQLEKMNKELQSFTYISSHDLQEPLRKIQTFAELIIDTEFANLSERGKNYFSRMHNAADRMQTLIHDLLSLSHANTLKGKFELTDLNEIIESVKVELADTQKMEDAIIEVEELGKFHIIPFQFEQLFFNLISNSLKFSKYGQPPRIKISSEIINGDKLKHQALLPGNTYLHITFQDHGIGFKEEYAEKIFEVFQRLHTKDKYAGTGIGLAIVKKIVENHNGFISAKSKLDKGTTFDIYIPISS
ncbi:PAS domain S-box protein [Sediminicola sp. 1XM1-17]|uniref:PAS domain S-box protein n=1 Tax=Sediminicola sp. 1XM1-17 TaxID=3127702 RepID=UPI003077941A